MKWEFPWRFCLWYIIGAVIAKIVIIILETQEIL